MKNKNKKISVLIPAKNESGNLKILVEKIIENLNKDYKNQFQIIIINDGSTDDTREIIPKNNVVSLINLEKSIGKAYALEEGLKYAEGEKICIIDADLQYQPKDMIKMIKHTDKYDFVNGRRTNRKDDLISKIGSLTYNFLLRIFLKIEIQDIFSGLKVFNANICNNIKYRGLIRFLALFAYKNKFKVIEIDIAHYVRYAGITKYNLIQRSNLFFLDLFTIIFIIILGEKKYKKTKKLVNIIFFVFSCEILIEFFFNFKFLNINIIYLIIILLFYLFFIYFVDDFYRRKII